MNINIKKTGLAALIALAVLSSMVATPVIAAGGIGWGGDSNAPNPTIEADVSRSASSDHPVRWPAVPER